MEDIRELSINCEEARKIRDAALDELRRHCHDDGQIAEKMRDVWRNQNSQAEL